METDKIVKNTRQILGNLYYAELYAFFKEVFLKSKNKTIVFATRQSEELAHLFFLILRGEHKVDANIDFYSTYHQSKDLLEIGYSIGTQLVSSCLCKSYKNSSFCKKKSSYGYTQKNNVSKKV
jgi:hypothetical protein